MVQYLQVSLVLDELLCAAVKQADMGVTFLDRLSAELQDQTQHTVSCRMLGTEVDGQVGHVLLCRRIFVCRRTTEEKRAESESKQRKSNASGSDFINQIQI